MLSISSVNLKLFFANVKLSFKLRDLKDVNKDKNKVNTFLIFLTSEIIAKNLQPIVVIVSCSFGFSNSF